MLKKAREYWSLVYSTKYQWLMMKNTSVGGSLYSCIAAWGPRNTGKGSLSLGLDHLSHDKWFCHLSTSDWLRTLELVTRLLRLRLMSELRLVWLRMIVNAGMLC